MQGRAGNLPEWDCLTCSPGWSRVHQLAMQDHQWQLEKEYAVAAQRFESALALRDLQRKEREGLVALVAQMLEEADTER